MALHLCVIRSTLPAGDAVLSVGAIKEMSDFSQKSDISDSLRECVPLIDNEASDAITLNYAGRLRLQASRGRILRSLLLIKPACIRVIWTFYCFNCSPSS